MIEGSQWLVFVGASLALVAIPGPAVLFIVARSLSGGVGVGLRTAAGIGLGNLCHAIAAAFGVSALIISTSWGLDLARYAGAAYLIYLGIRSFVQSGPREGASAERESSERLEGSFRKGILVALLNPKVILFLVAFLPQFVNHEAGNVPRQLLVLGVSFVAIGYLGDSAWALLSGVLTSKLRRGSVSGFWVRLPAVIYILLGLLTASSKLVR
ncbi:LysE family translocator [Pelagicoccus albus]|uniref:LysE family translocator n=1 Tax=Pelagicoccus albus TaxID=415222 RepID=A0A7X1E8W1_9BACT|nr:LysE family translocator [Pelagicoccus albus]MBC2606543.1 LysE family translocator [Pelagicoccus albus]